MLLVIRNLPSSTRYSDIKALIKEKCGVTEMIVDNLANEGPVKRVTVGVADDTVANVLMDTLNMTYMGSNQLHVEKVRSKTLEQPFYRREFPKHGNKPFHQQKTMYVQNLPARTPLMQAPQPAAPIADTPAPNFGLPFYMTAHTSNVGSGNSLMSQNSKQPAQQARHVPPGRNNNFDQQLTGRGFRDRSPSRRSRSRERSPYRRSSRWESDSRSEGLRGRDRSPPRDRDRHASGGSTEQVSYPSITQNCGFGVRDDDRYVNSSNRTDSLWEPSRFSGSSSTTFSSSPGNSTFTKSNDSARQNTGLTDLGRGSSTRDFYSPTRDTWRDMSVPNKSSLKRFNDKKSSFEPPSKVWASNLHSDPKNQPRGSGSFDFVNKPSSMQSDNPMFSNSRQMESKQQLRFLNNQPQKSYSNSLSNSRPQQPNQQSRFPNNPSSQSNQWQRFPDSLPQQPNQQLKFSNNPPHQPNQHSKFPDNPSSQSKQWLRFPNSVPQQQNRQSEFPNNPPLQSNQRPIFPNSLPEQPNQQLKFSKSRPPQPTQEPAYRSARPQTSTYRAAQPNYRAVPPKQRPDFQSNSNPNVVDPDTAEQTMAPSMSSSSLKDLITKHHGWRSQAASDIANQIYKNLKLQKGGHKKQPVFIQLKASIRSRLDVITGDDLSMRPTVMVEKYRKTFKESDDPVFYKAVLQKVDRGQRQVFEAEATAANAPELETANKLPEEITNEDEDEDKSTADVKSEGDVATAETNPAATPTIPILNVKVEPGAKRLPRHPFGNKVVEVLQETLQKQELIDDSMYVLPPLIGQAVEDEIDKICDIYRHEIQNPEDLYETIILKHMEKVALPEFRKLTALTLKKRILDIRTNLVLRIYCHQKYPNRDRLDAFLKGFGVLSVKKPERKKKMYIATCGSYDDFDMLCKLGTAKLDDTEISFKPMHVMPPLKKNYKSKKKGQQVADIDEELDLNEEFLNEDPSDHVDDEDFEDKKDIVQCKEEDNPNTDETFGDIFQNDVKIEDDDNPEGNNCNIDFTEDVDFKPEDPSEIGYNIDGQMGINTDLGIEDNQNTDIQMDNNSDFDIKNTKTVNNPDLGIQDNKNTEIQMDNNSDFDNKNEEDTDNNTVNNPDLGIQDNKSTEIQMDNNSDFKNKNKEDTDNKTVNNPGLGIQDNKSTEIQMDNNSDFDNKNKEDIDNKTVNNPDLGIQDNKSTEVQMDNNSDFDNKNKEDTDNKTVNNPDLGIQDNKSTEVQMDNNSDFDIKNKEDTDNKTVKIPDLGIKDNKSTEIQMDTKSDFDIKSNEGTANKTKNNSNLVIRENENIVEDDLEDF